VPRQAGVPVSLVRIATRDGAWLDGLVTEPRGRRGTALIWVHGLGSVFSSGQPLTRELSARLNAAGIAYFKLNNRGHDVVARGGRQLAGAAFERFRQSILDIRAMVSFVRLRGYRRVILAGHYSILEPDAISIEPAAHEFLHEYRRKVRIVHWMLTSALILLREALRSGRWLIAFQLLSHKINRWLVSFWLLALLPLSLALAGEAPVYTLAAAAQVLVYSGALAGMAAGRAGWRIPKLLSLPLYFVVVNVASLVAIVSLVTGREVQWHKRPDRAS